MIEQESEFLRHVPCRACGSSDANSLYTDGHTHCFACGAHDNGEGAVTKARRKVAGELLQGEYSAIPSRRINEDTCRKLGYTIAEYKGKLVQVATYYDADGNAVAQKVRGANKQFAVLGSLDDALPFGAHAWPKAGKMLVVTEGEMDALSMSQVQGNKWPVVSIACGAGPQVRKYIAKHRDYFLKFEKVVIMFDADEPGREAAKIAAEVIGRRALIAELPLKDANEMLVAGRTDELINAMWKAQPYRPDGIVELSDIAAKVCEVPEAGKSWKLPTLTALSYGRRPGEVWVLGAGVGTGKTDLLIEEAEHVISFHKEPVGLFFLEAAPQDIAIRLAGKHVGQPLHIPDPTRGPEVIHNAVKALADTHRVFLYDAYGMAEWDNIKERIRFLHHAYGVRYFVIDNLTAFVAGAEDERRELERVMAEAAGLAQEIQSFFWIVSHLATPEGTPHENGGMVTLRHLKGARAIAAWAHYSIGLERDQQAEDEVERRTTTVRILKDRFSGRSTGKTFQIRYDFATGMLSEVNDFQLADEKEAASVESDF